MTELLSLILISFSVTSIFMVPFIDLLYFLKRRFEKIAAVKTGRSDTPIHDQLMKGDEQIPSGGGILLISLLGLLTLAFAFFSRTADSNTLKILLLTLLSFGALGFIDDIKWIVTKRKGKLLGLGRKVMLPIQATFALIIGWMIYDLLGLNNIYITGIGNFIIDLWFIPLAAFTIVAFANAYNITDGLDGLSTGLLAICLFALLAIASNTLNVTLASFIGIWIGTLFAFLYFNVYPARIFLGDAGAFAFGAALAVVGLLTGKILALAIIGGMYVIIVSSSLIQILAKRFLGRKIFPVAPIHMYFKYIGWEEPKVVARFWLAGAVLAILGLWLALVT